MSRPLDQLEGLLRRVDALAASHEEIRRETLRTRANHLAALTLALAAFEAPRLPAQNPANDVGSNAQTKAGRRAA